MIRFGMAVLLVAPSCGGEIAPCASWSICLRTGWVCFSTSTLVISVSRRRRSQDSPPTPELQKAVYPVLWLLASPHHLSG